MQLVPQFCWVLALTGAVTALPTVKKDELQVISPRYLTRDDTHHDGINPAALEGSPATSTDAALESPHKPPTPRIDDTQRNEETDSTSRAVSHVTAREEATSPERSKKHGYHSLSRRAWKRLFRSGSFWDQTDQVLLRSSEVDTVPTTSIITTPSPTSSATPMTSEPSETSGRTFKSTGIDEVQNAPIPKIPMSTGTNTAHIGTFPKILTSTGRNTTQNGTIPGIFKNTGKLARQKRDNPPISAQVSTVLPEALKEILDFNKTSASGKPFNITIKHTQCMTPINKTAYFSPETYNASSIKDSFDKAHIDPYACLNDPNLGEVSEEEEQLQFKDIADFLKTLENSDEFNEIKEYFSVDKMKQRDFQFVKIVKERRPVKIVKVQRVEPVKHEPMSP